MRDYRSIIKKIKPMDQQEVKDKDLILKWLSSGQAIYREENSCSHLCAYFPLVSLEKHEMFLVLHKKSGLWLPNGGHVEKGETLEGTVVRELKEELGLSWQGDIKPFFASRITTVGKTAGHIHNDIWFLIKIDSKTEFRPNREEFHDWGWFTLDHVCQKSSEPNITRAVEKIRQFL